MSNQTNSEDNGQLHLESTLEMIYEMPNFNRWIYDLIEPYLGPRVVEVGCGVGSFTHLLSEQQREVIATDIEPAYIERVRQSFNGSPGVQAFQYDIGAKLPPELAEFGADAVVCMNVLEHIEDDRHAMGNIANMLAPGGKSIVLVPAFPWLYGSMDEHYRHCRRYRKEELEQLARSSSLKVLDTFYVNLAGIPGWWFSGHVLRRKVLPSAGLKLYHRLVPLFRVVEKLTGPPLGLSLVCVARKKDGGA